METILTKDVSRTFRTKKGVIKALENTNISVNAGELFGVLGPNGAGKTTLIKILSTLLLPTSGEAYVLGYNVEKEANKIKPRINMVSGGEFSGYGLLTVKENLWMFSQFYGIPSKEAKKRINELLELVQLEDKKDSKVRTLSSGQRQKMNIIRGFMTDPDVIFLDEPTLGLDVTTSRTIRKFIQNWLREDRSRTILLTTHHMLEAEELCDRIAVIDNGKVLVVDTPENLKQRVRRDVVLNLVVEPVVDVNWVSSMEGVKGCLARERENGLSLLLRVVLEDDTPIADILAGITNQNARVVHVEKKEPTLEDVFLALVGKGLE
ncbi:MAG: hypothetical protein DRO11_01930 [Methanobacteriota archaeon]|nr:MAG: hypothetical protein DRO11_01930 [Euryarchaeota archaeon]